MDTNLAVSSAQKVQPLSDPGTLTFKVTIRAMHSQLNDKVIQVSGKPTETIADLKLALQKKTGVYDYRQRICLNAEPTDTDRDNNSQITYEDELTNDTLLNDDRLKGLQLYMVKTG